MTWARRTSHPVAAIAAVFFVNGMAFASWIPRIPEVQSSLALSNLALGLVLAAGGAGGLVGTVVSPALLRRAGSRPVAVLAGAALAVILPLIAVAPAAIVLAVVLLAAATADALTDIAMNDLGVRTQHGAGRSLMNRLHAGWSFGAVAGASTSSVVAAAGVPLGLHLTALAVLLVAVLAVAWRHLPALGPVVRPAASRRAAAGVAGVLMPLALAAALVEGIPAEWSSVFLASEHAMGPGEAGIGFTLFAAAMLAGRLVGDTVTDAVGVASTGRIATGCTATGLAAVATSPGPVLAVVGFTLLGLGASVLFPLIYGAAGSLSAVASGAGLALMSVGARLGFMSGSPLVGGLSDLVGLRAAITVLVAGALVAVAVSRARLAHHLA